MSPEAGFPEPANYFLSGTEPTDNVKFLAPVRTGNHVQPLVDGIETFSSMEEAINGAEASVYVAFWIFNPNTPLLSTRVRKSGLRTWADLLRETAGRGVDVRVLLTGFDPLLGADLHRTNWGAYRNMVLEATRLVGKNKDRLQTIVSLHPATVSVGIGSLLAARRVSHIASLNRLLSKKVGKGTQALSKFANWPGLWQWVEYQPKAKKFAARSGSSLHASPAAHHQKVVVVDETLAFCGGLDVNTGRISTTAHDNPSNFWHDLDARIEGATALEVCRTFIGRWNAEAPVFEAFVRGANKTAPPTPMILHTAKPDLKLKVTKPPNPGKAWVQIQRTRSVDAAFAAVPRTVQDDIKRSYQQAIRQAQQFIYIENQYVRSLELGEWIIERAKNASELRVLIVLPVAPEEVGKTGKGDEVTEHGLALQRELFTNLRRELKDRVGLYSPIMKVKALGISKTETHGSPQIYVHTKLLLVDDRFASIASANANPRSFYVDTEVAAAWFEPPEVRKLRLRLWGELLGNPAGMASWKPTDFVGSWNSIAIANEKAALDKRQGFIIRHDEAKFPGKKSSMIPDEFANVFNGETGTQGEDDLALT